MYEDDDETCEKTYATLLIYPGDLDPDNVTSRLGLRPTQIAKEGKPTRHGRSAVVARLNGWFLSSKGVLDSKDARRHLDWVLDQLTPRSEAVRALQDLGARVEMACYWLSAHGQGGPTLSPQQMRKMASLDIDLWFDVYVIDVDEVASGRQATESPACDNLTPWSGHA